MTETDPRPELAAKPAASQKPPPEALLTSCPDLFRA